MSIEHEQRNAIQSCIALIEQYRMPQLLSVTMTLVSILMVLLLTVMNTLDVVWFVVLAVIIIIGMVEIVYAIRIGLDISLLRQVSDHPESIEAGLAALDRVLLKLRLLPSTKVGRKLDVRLSGCMRLFTTHAALCVAQIHVVLGAAIVQLAIPYYNNISIY